MARSIEISSKAVAVLFTLLLSLWLLVQLSSVLVSLLFALVLALGLTPFVDHLCRYKLPRPLSVLLIFVLFLGILGGIFAVAFVPMVDQTQRLVEKLPQFAAAIQLPGSETLDKQFVNSLAKEWSSVSGSLLGAAVGFFDNALAVVTVLVLTFYFLVDFPRLKNKFVGVFPRNIRPKVEDAITEIELKVGGWLRGQLFLMFTIGLASFVGLSLIGLDFALSLSLVAGILEIIPMVGPIVSMIPALIVAAATSPLMTVLVLIFYIIVQQLENNLIVPKVMEKAVGISPMMTLVVILIGGKLLGVAGAFLAVPASMIFYIVGKTLLELEWE